MTKQTLFPETLLVEQNADHIFTTSLKVAEHFQKRHDNVLKAIKKLLTECESLRNFAESDNLNSEFSLLNFEESEFQNERGKTYPMYRLTHDGFAVLAMGFTGPKALQWKIDFLNAFRAMESEIKQHTQARANAMGFLRPHWPLIIDGLKVGMKRSQICQLTGHKSPNTITANKRRMKQAGLLL